MMTKEEFALGESSTASPDTTLKCELSGRFEPNLNEFACSQDCASPDKGMDGVNMWITSDWDMAATSTAIGAIVK